MSGSGEETYSTMFASLRHPARRKILRMLAEKSRSFSEMLEELGISSSHLTYHLENLGELVSKMEDGKYKLSTFGEAAVATMSRVEEVPKTKEPEHVLPLPVKWKFLVAALMIGLVILASVCSLQYQFLSQASTEYEQLRVEYEQVFKEYERLEELVALTHFGDVSLQSECTLRFFLRQEPGATRFDIEGPWDCVIYSPYDNSTLYLILSIATVMEKSYLALSIQEGNAYDSRTNETAPVIHSLNAYESSIFYMPLPSKGWYTISLTGPIGKYLDASGRVVGYTGAFRVLGTSQDIDCSLSIRIIHERNYISFIVTHGAFTWSDVMMPSG